MRKLALLALAWGWGGKTVNSILNYSAGVISGLVHGEEGEVAVLKDQRFERFRQRRDRHFSHSEPHHRGDVVG